MMDAGADLDARVRYLESLPHAQRSILLVLASVVVQHPRGVDIIREIQAHHPDLDRQRLCIQVLLDVMISISGDWNSGSSLLLPVAKLIDQAIARAIDESEPICPVALAGQLWELIECVHERAEPPAVLATEPSNN
jgi:hypothetical protein